MLRIGYDISSLTGRQISGVGVYTTRLLKALRAKRDLEVVPFYRLSRWKYRDVFESHVGACSSWVNGWSLNLDVVHGPDFRVVKSSARRVVTIHDLAFLTEGMTSAKFAQKKTDDLNRVFDSSPPDIVITVSEATKRDLIRYRPETASKIHVVYLGGDHLIQNQSDESQSELVPQGLNASEPYFLFVGNLEARKNVLGILRAFEQFAKSASHSSVKLKLVGKPGFGGEEILDAIKKSSISNRIELIGYCESSELKTHYRNAIALVYPSWIEGFGLPLIEAMHLGCPVITSGATSTGEITADAGWLVEPNDIQSIANSMEEVMTLAPELRAARIAKGRARAASFTWDRCANGTLIAYQAALGAKK